MKEQQGQVVTLCCPHDKVKLNIPMWAFCAGRTMTHPQCSGSFRIDDLSHFRPITLDPSWLTPTVKQLATVIYEERQFGKMSLLGDALEEAGCDNEDVLKHCRGRGEHARGCWVVDKVLGKE